MGFDGNYTQLIASVGKKPQTISEKVHTLNSSGKDFFRLGVKALLSKALSVPWANGSLQFERKYCTSIREWNILKTC